MTPVTRRALVHNAARLSPPLAMHRFSRSVTRWLLAAFAASLLLAWPLHEAQHARQPISKLALAALDLAVTPAGDDGTSPGDDAKTGSCLWCLFHAEHHAPPGTPPALRFHAEASAPPVSLPCGLPAGRCALAAHPRGPPQA